MRAHADRNRDPSIPVDVLLEDLLQDLMLLGDLTSSKYEAVEKMPTPKWFLDPEPALMIESICLMGLRNMATQVAGAWTREQKKYVEMLIKKL